MKKIIVASEKGENIFQNRPQAQGTYTFASGGSIEVDVDQLKRVSRYAWSYDRQGRVMCNMTTQQNRSWNFDKPLKPKSRRIKVDLRRYLWDLTDYTNTNLRKLTFINGDRGDYRLRNIPVATIIKAPTTIFPDVMILLDKDLRGTYGAIAFLPDGREQLFPLPEFNKKRKYMTTPRRGYLEGAATAKVWEAARYYDDYTMKLMGPTYPRYNFLSTLGL